MTAENFVYWLQGCLEINGNTSFSEEQVQIIKDHIALVLKKETPQSSGRSIITYPQVPPQPLWTPPIVTC